MSRRTTERVRKDSSSNGNGWENLGTSHVDLRAELAASPLDLVRRLWRFPLRARRNRLLWWTSTTLVLVLLLGGIEVLSRFSRVELPPSLGHPLVPVLLTLLILFCALQSYQQSLRSLAFYRRFVRPGLRDIVERESETLLRGEKLFRGRHAVLLKIDIEGSTFVTFDMPYGVRRLFLDLWFTLVDEVVARDVFLDKSLGDGSLYCFDAERGGGACTAALAAARRIRDETLPRFDVIFRAQLAELISTSSDLAVNAGRYFERYQKRAGESFWERRTEARMALVCGQVDEGLWGLSSQSHYDVQGTPVILVTRLEEEACRGEIVLDASFISALEIECGGAADLPADLIPRLVDVRGIGERRVFALPRPGGDDASSGPERVLPFAPRFFR